MTEKCYNKVNEELRIPTKKQLKAMRVHADKVVKRMVKRRAKQIGAQYSYVKERENATENGISNLQG